VAVAPKFAGLTMIVVGSFAMLSAVKVSPPPDTLTILMMLAGALLFTFTVSVIAG